MKKIIFVSAIQIFPPLSGGQLRSANICRSLTKLGHEVEIYSYTGRKKDYFNFKKSSEESIEHGLKEYTNRFFLWGFLQMLSYRINIPPFWIWIMTKLHLPNVLKNKLESANSVIIDFPYLSPLKKHFPYKFHLNTHNAEFELWKNNLALSGIVKNIELESLKKVDNVLFCNRDDHNKFIAEYPELPQKSFILPNGLDTDKYKLNELIRKNNRKALNIEPSTTVFFFSGSQYRPNHDAYEFLEEWCQINHKKLNELNALILIAGSVSKKKVAKKHFIVSGEVEDILPYLWSSDYGLNPIIYGSGTNVKMMEYIATQIPILSTEFGIRGLNLENKKSCLIFDKTSLIKTIEEAVFYSKQKRENMATMAFQQNIKKINMSLAIQELPISW